MRNHTFNIVKALAIILVVACHAGGPAWFNHTVFLFHVPVFFICAGYFFHTKYLNDERTFVVRRVRGLYVPFVKWSLFFLIIHNVLFPIGLLSETYGNSGGGVTHPFTLHQTVQHAISIVCNMSGYDPFLGGTFWFFRALFLSSIAFLFLFKLLRRLTAFSSDKAAGWGIALIALLMAYVKVDGPYSLTGIAQGGYRELMGLFFMGVGFLFRQYGLPRGKWWLMAGCVVVGLSAAYLPTSMAWNPTLTQFLSLPLPAICGFVILFIVADKLNGRLRPAATEPPADADRWPAGLSYASHDRPEAVSPATTPASGEDEEPLPHIPANPILLTANRLRTRISSIVVRMQNTITQIIDKVDRKLHFSKNIAHALCYIGERTLYIFAFHLLAFKVAGAIKIGIYSLPWEAIGGHPYVLQPANNALIFLLYTVCGVGLPLLWIAGYRATIGHIDLPFVHWADLSLEAIAKVLSGGGMGLRRTARFCATGIYTMARNVWSSFCQTIKDIMDASNTADE